MRAPNRHKAPPGPRRKPPRWAGYVNDGQRLEDGSNATIISASAIAAALGQGNSKWLARGRWQYCANPATPRRGNRNNYCGIPRGRGLWSSGPLPRLREIRPPPVLARRTVFRLQMLGLVKLLSPRDMQCPLRTRRSARIKLRTLRAGVRNNESLPGPIHGPPAGAAERVLVNSSLIRC
jgi:hypothetical protein